MSAQRPSLTLLVGDWNLTPDRVAAIAREVGGAINRGRGVDHLVASLIGRAAVEVDDLGTHGSDHHALLYRLTLDDGTVLRLLSWNVYVGQRPERVRSTVTDLVAQHRPHLVALVETYRCRAELRQVPGYQLAQGRPAPGGSPDSERAETAVLIRDDLTVLGTGAMRMGRRWVGPHGRGHGPRQYRRVRVRLGSGRVVRLAVVHLPTGGETGRNAAAVRESINRLQRWGRGRA